MRDSSHAHLMDFARRSAIERDRISRMKVNYREVEKAAHFRQLAAIGLFAINVLIWGMFAVELLK